jgi:hypothetical protein
VLFTVLVAISNPIGMLVVALGCSHGTMHAPQNLATLMSKMRFLMAANIIEPWVSGSPDARTPPCHINIVKPRQTPAMAHCPVNLVKSNDTRFKRVKKQQKIQKLSNAGIRVPPRRTIQLGGQRPPNETLRATRGHP